LINLIGGIKTTKRNKEPHYEKETREKKIKV
jgi:hypothetical protein